MGEQQVQKLGEAKELLFTPSSACPSFPSWMQYIPLRAWLYRDGFARFSNTRFTLSSIDDQCILGSLPTHLPCTLPLSYSPAAQGEFIHSTEPHAVVWPQQIGSHFFLWALTVLWGWGSP